MLPQSAPTLGWHWSSIDAGEPVASVSLSADAKLELCKCGFHYCPDLLDSFRYGAGMILARVRGQGPRVSSHDKVATQAREIIWWVDATDLIDRWSGQFNILPSPSRLPQLHACLLGQAAQAAWQRDCAVQTWADFFRDKLNWWRNYLATAVTIFAQHKGVWSPDPQE